MEKWQDPKVIAFWIAIIVVFILTLLFFVVRILYTGYKRMTEANLRETQMLIDHQKMLLESALEVQEKERTRIAADLHDTLIGKLTVIRMKTQIGAQTGEIEAMLGESITEARRISHDLTPPLLEFSRMEELIAEVLDPWKVKLAIWFYTDVRSTDDLTPEMKIQLLRVTQELLTNIIKHANATQVLVDFKHTPKGILLRVYDNGSGFDTSEMKRGIGLNSLELRIQYLKARYRITSGKGKGTTTILAAPL